MQKIILLSCLALALSGCDEYWRSRFGLGGTPSGKSCSQPYQEMAYVENRTTTAQTLEFSVYDPIADGARRTFSTTIAAGHSLSQKIRDYSKEIPGGHGDDYPIDAYCDGTLGTSTIDVNLTGNSFAQVKLCHVGDGSGLAYLVDAAAVCPAFTKQQTGPL